MTTSKVYNQLEIHMKTMRMEFKLVILKVVIAIREKNESVVRYHLGLCNSIVSGERVYTSRVLGYMQTYSRYERKYYLILYIECHR